MAENFKEPLKQDDLTSKNAFNDKTKYLEIQKN